MGTNDKDQDTKDQDLDTTDQDQDTDDQDTKDQDTKDQDSDDNSKDTKQDLVDREELRKVIAKRDEVKQKLRETVKRNKEMEEKLAELDKVQSQLEELKTAKEELDAINKEREEKELAKKTEAEKEAIRARKEKEQLEAELNSKVEELTTKLQEKDTKLEELSSNVEALRNIKLENEIISVSTKFDAINPNQIYKLVKDEFTFDEDDQAFYKNVYSKNGNLKDQISVADYIEDFLSDDDNSNLVKGNLKRGSGDNAKSNAGGKTSPSVPIQRESEKYSKKEVIEKLKTWLSTKPKNLDENYDWNNDDDRKWAVSMYEKLGDRLFSM